MELLRKLKSRGVDDALAQTVIAELQASGWQDDVRYVESFVRSRCARGQGPVRIRAELRQKGIDATLTEAVLADLAIDWHQIAERVYRRKYGDRPIADRNDYGRRYRFLAQRGFETEQIRTLLDEA